MKRSVPDFHEIATTLLSWRQMVCTSIISHIRSFFSMARKISYGFRHADQSRSAGLRLTRTSGSFHWVLVLARASSFLGGVCVVPDPEELLCICVRASNSSSCSDGGVGVRRSCRMTCRGASCSASRCMKAWLSVGCSARIGRARYLWRVDGQAALARVVEVALMVAAPHTRYLANRRAYGREDHCSSWWYK